MAKRYKSPHKRGSGVSSRKTATGRTFTWGGLKSAPKRAVKAVTRVIK